MCLEELALSFKGDTDGLAGFDIALPAVDYRDVA